ncbi:response regulator transcription factor [Paenibacillus lutimineralis]|uniref:DNA-binding response regulator n=1 Tax=Paenibacillus lutimineralis TaxID=2707005 RepID=A0A3S9V1X5_9BACL|nr:response regulator transcription factor [Paenibacillus lutimineralis]AZS16568.1 DNA-binding response regulator [Paenibacillus lutimineralis]
MRILIVEDEKHLAEAVAQVLKKNNYTVDLAHDGEYGLDCAISAIYDFIILDIMLPKIDGITILKEIRKHGISVPVVLLTAKGETEDTVNGLDSGADDYIAKPFKSEELLARLRALNRRKGELIQDGTLTYGDINIYPNSLELFCGNKSYKLTLKEFQLLELLINMRGMVVSKNTIIEKLWGYDGEAEDNNVEVYISFLRKKLSHIKSETSIHTMRGVGYVLRSQGDKHV